MATTTWNVVHERRSAERPPQEVAEALGLSVAADPRAAP